MSFLPGYKSHIVAFLILLTGVVKVLSGDASGWDALAENVNYFLGAGGLTAIRLAVAKGR